MEASLEDLVAKGLICYDKFLQLDYESQMINDVLISHNIPVKKFHFKHLQRRQIQLHTKTLVVGTIDTVHLALRYLNKPKPENNCYPSSIISFLKRKIWKSTIGEIKTEIRMGNLNYFVKPVEPKLFSGFVCEDPNCGYKFGNLSSNTPVYCSEVVDWIVEYRVYVCDSNILGISYYSGDKNRKIDVNIVKNCIETLKNSSDNTRGYAIDFGVLSCGATALIEWNDGYSLGCYEDMDVNLYTKLICTRWQELMES